MEITCQMSIEQFAVMFLLLPRTVLAYQKLIPFVKVRLLVKKCSLKMPGFYFDDRQICGFSCVSEEESLVLNALDRQALAIACASIYVRYIVLSPSNVWKEHLTKLETLEKRDSTENVYERKRKSYQSIFNDHGSHLGIGGRANV